MSTDLHSGGPVPATATPACPFSSDARIFSLARLEFRYHKLRAEGANHKANKLEDAVRAAILGTNHRP